MVCKTIVLKSSIDVFINKNNVSNKYHVKVTVPHYVSFPLIFSVCFVTNWFKYDFNRQVIYYCICAERFLLLVIPFFTPNAGSTVKRPLFLRPTSSFSTFCSWQKLKLLVRPHICLPQGIKHLKYFWWPPLLLFRLLHCHTDFSPFL